MRFLVHRYSNTHNNVVPFSSATFDAKNFGEKKELRI
jgi:hypothetical protein